MTYDAAVTILSVLISLQFAMAAVDNKKHRRAVVALGLKSAMFSLYAITGFLPSLVSVPEFVIYWLKWLLIALAVAFFASNQSRVIFNGLRDD